MSIKRLWGVAEEVLSSAGLESPRLEVPKEPAFGELSCTSAFELAKKLKRPPIEIAREIAEAANRVLSSRGNGLIALVEAREPGFVNFRVNWQNYAKLILDEVSSLGDSYGFSNVGKGRTVLLEHTSVNPNKPLHLGHARNVVIGDTLNRLLSKMGYRVIVANYIDDSGNQMADLHVAFRSLGYKLDPEGGKRFDEYCGELYAEVNKRIEEDPELSALKRRIIAELEDRSSESFRFNQTIVSRVLFDHLSTCWRLGARYDMLNRESDILSFGLWNDVFTLLKEKRIVYLAESGPKKGCWLVKLSDHPVLGKEGDEVIVKSDGTTTYVARDIAYAAWKVGLLSKDFRYAKLTENPDGTTVLITDVDGDLEYEKGDVGFSVTVIDSRQRRPQEVIRFVLKSLGVPEERYVHFGYEVVALSKSDAEKLGVEVDGEKFVHMSGREGLYLTVDAVLNLIKGKAVEEAAKRHPDWPRERLEETGERIAIATLRYSLLKQDTDKMIVFDSEEAADLEGDTGPYIQYSYARAARILEKAGDAGDAVTVPKELHEEEKSLLRAISLMPLVFDEAVRLLLLKKVAVYAHELAASFNDFYEACPVISAPPSERAFRLKLVKAFMTALRNTCSTLGIPLLDEM